MASRRKEKIYHSTFVRSVCVIAGPAGTKPPKCQYFTVALETKRGDEYFFQSTHRRSWPHSCIQQLLAASAKAGAGGRSRPTASGDES